MSRSDKQLQRREFIKKSLLGTGAIISVAGFKSLSAAKPTSENWKMPMHTLGRTGEKVSKFGIGCAPFQHISPEEVNQILTRALDLGVNYLDVAPNYGNDERGYSEEKMGPTIKEIRDQVFLVTKTEESTRDGTWRLMEQSMARMQTDHLDMVHIHNFGWEDRFPDAQAALGKDGTLGALQEAREQGVIKYIAASGHLYPSRFHAALDTGEIDAVMNAVNFIVQHTYDFESKVWSRARRENLGLIAMKVLGGSSGSGFRLPDQDYEKAIRYAISLEGLSTAVIGVKSLQELELAARTVATSETLSEVEQHELAQYGLKLAATDSWKSSYGTPVT
jgi:aryl-alcohol dehydrogenase-like predicted oxidoreductase